MRCKRAGAKNPVTKRFVLCDVRGCADRWMPWQSPRQAFAHRAGRGWLLRAESSISGCQADADVQGGLLAGDNGRS